MKILEIRTPEGAKNNISEYNAKRLMIMHGCDFAVSTFVYKPSSNYTYPVCHVINLAEISESSVKLKLMELESTDISQEELNEIYNKFKSKKHWWKIWKQ